MIKEYEELEKNSLDSYKKAFDEGVQFSANQTRSTIAELEKKVEGVKD